MYNITYLTNLPYYWTYYILIMFNVYYEYTHYYAHDILKMFNECWKYTPYGWNPNIQ